MSLFFNDLQNHVKNTFLWGYCAIENKGLSNCTSADPDILLHETPREPGFCCTKCRIEADMDPDIVARLLAGMWREYDPAGAGRMRGAVRAGLDGAGTGGPTPPLSSDPVPPSFEDVVGQSRRRGRRTPGMLLILKEMAAPALSRALSTFCISGLLSVVCGRRTFVLPRDCCVAIRPRRCVVVATPLFSMRCEDRCSINN